MTELTLAIIDNTTGDLLVDDKNQAISQAAQTDLTDMLGTATGFGCAKPARTIHQLPTATHGDTVRIGGYWHDSHVEGPGRRSVVRFQGCPIRCKGCWVPETWSTRGGTVVSIDALADALLSPSYERDGVTILGGEPFAQPEALSDLVMALVFRQSLIHITVYTGYTLETLFARRDNSIDMVLATIDVLIDGPYIKEQSDTAGRWTGSGNQRVIDMVATQLAGMQPVLLTAGLTDDQGSSGNRF